MTLSPQILPATAARKQAVCIVVPRRWKLTDISEPPTRTVALDQADVFIWERFLFASQEFPLTTEFRHMPEP